MYNIELKKTPCQEIPGQVTAIRNAGDAVRAALPLLKEEDGWRETCHALMTDRNGNIIGHFLVGIGDEKNVTIGVKAVCAVAISCLAHGVVLVHNHPSGNPTPGKADIEQTEHLRRALSVFDISLLDHIVLGEGRYYSFSEEADRPIVKTETAVKKKRA